jgi:hypothetical protein
MLEETEKTYQTRHRTRKRRKEEQRQSRLKTTREANAKKYCKNRKMKDK